MKTRILFLICVFVMMTGNMAAGFREDQWKQVEDLIQKGLPKSAIELLGPVVESALQDRAFGEAAKAILERVALEGSIQGNMADEKIRLLEVQMAKSPVELLPILQTVKAHWYWEYFRNNRWRFMQRTATSEAPGRDITTWDVKRLFAEIDKQFQAALVNADILQKTPVSVFDRILKKGTIPDQYRPTLYDFIVQEALKFYTSGEQAGAQPEDTFSISADSSALDEANLFINWQKTFSVKEFPDSPIIKALGLYAKLLSFHDADSDHTALADVDLSRLVYCYNVSIGDSKNERFHAALNSFTQRYGDNEISSQAFYEWSQALHKEGDLEQAHAKALLGMQRHPKSQGGQLCRNLILEIEAKQLSLSTEQVWNAPSPQIEVTYKNITNVYFRVIAWNWDEFLQKNHARPANLNDADRKQLLRKNPTLKWQSSLPATLDYKLHVESLTAPNNLKPGFYFLVSSHNPLFNELDNQVCYTSFWVSDLALVIRPRAGFIEGFVLQAGSGEPLAGAEINAWHLSNHGDRIPAPPLMTDAEGFFRMRSNQENEYLIRARYKGQQIASEEEFQSYRPDAGQTSEQTLFFTDRSLYRPGQTIHYKGLCLRVNAGKNLYETLRGGRVKVVFADSNEKEIASVEHPINEYGSFSGSFIAPQDRLNGQMRLFVSKGPEGQTCINVEEYKRPKFQISIDAPKAAVRLNEKAMVRGKAESYTGAPVNDALVNWRVVREVRWPSGWGWNYSNRREASQEIAHGTAHTQLDGSFNLEFIAKCDPKTAENDGVSFTFSVYADVTDTTGETRSTQRGIHVGFAALAANLSAEEWQTEDKAVSLNVKTETLDGEPEPAKGTLRVYRLKEPAQVQRKSLMPVNHFIDPRGSSNERPDASNPNSWELGKLMNEHEFTTAADGKASLSLKLPEGLYRAVLESQDAFGKKVFARLPLTILKPGSTRCSIKIPQLLAAPKWKAEPGETFKAVWGTGYESGRAFIEIEHRNRLIARYWTMPGQTQQEIQKVVDETLRGGFTLHVTQVRENRAYLYSRFIEVPWNNKELTIKWEHFTSKLLPGQKEKWSLEICGPNAQKAAAEMVATLYDQSLNAYQVMSWPQMSGLFYQDQSSARISFANELSSFTHLWGEWAQLPQTTNQHYREFSGGLLYSRTWGERDEKMPLMALSLPNNIASGGAMLAARSKHYFNAPAKGALVLAERSDARSLAKPESKPEPDLEAMKRYGLAASDAAVRGGSKTDIDLATVAARKNLNETAFFFPQLRSDSNGNVRLEFTMPEALTTWKFMGFAHDAGCRSGFIEAKAITSKDLMVQPNPPRFLREGDVLEFTVKISNQSTERQQGTARLVFADAANGESYDKVLANLAPEKGFDLPAGESRSFAWRIQVPDGAPFLTYKAVASTGHMSDGEEGFLPVLSRRIWVTESLPLPIRGPATKQFQFASLLNSAKSDTLQHRSLTVQMVSNPAWYAVMGLPYLMEFPHECAEQTFNRFYANALAQFLANRNPKIRTIFNQWKATPALDSPMEKNQDLKSVMIEETPWLRQAQNENQARRSVGLLFDNNRLSTELESTLHKLAQMQLSSGAWAWFPGGHANDFITLYIMTGFGRLRHLGANVNVTLAMRSLNRLDASIANHYLEIQKSNTPDEYVLGATDCLYLYGRSFFLKDLPVAPDFQKAVQFFLSQGRKNWLKTGDRMSQGQLALALKRWGGEQNLASARDIVRSLKERSVTDGEMGRFWRDTEISGWWYRAPIESQAVMIEVLDEVAGDLEAMEECKVWLLKQKQTQDWKTTKATADAIYALLLRGQDLLASDKPVEVSLGGVTVKPSADPALKSSGAPTIPAVEAGTGFYEKRFPASEIRTQQGEITVKKADAGVSWGSVHWQYLEDIGKIAPYAGNPLQLKKTIYIKSNSSQGPVLNLVKGKVSVGDELVVRIELKADRDMEYVHLKDQRGSGVEPVNVLSGYRYQDGLAYYQSTRDTASHFFIDYLPKGVYVFEYSARIQLRGEYQSGMASIQCMYAPEFNSHSESKLLQVQ